VRTINPIRKLRIAVPAIAIRFKLLKRAIELEKEAIQTYNEMMRDADPETSELLDYLISQEKEHIKLLSDRLNAVKLMRK